MRIRAITALIAATLFGAILFGSGIFVADEFGTVKVLWADVCFEFEPSGTDRKELGATLIGSVAAFDVPVSTVKPSACMNAHERNIKFDVGSNSKVYIAYSIFNHTREEELTLPLDLELGQEVKIDESFFGRWPGHAVRSLVISDAKGTVIALGRGSSIDHKVDWLSVSKGAAVYRSSDSCGVSTGYELSVRANRKSISVAPGEYKDFKHGDSMYRFFAIRYADYEATNPCTDVPRDSQSEWGLVRIAN